MDIINFSVPGNLLLMGEYSILEENGLGLSIAIKERAYFSFRKNDTWRFFAKKTKIDNFTLIENNKDFIFKIFKYLKQKYFANIEDFPFDVYVDTSNFFLNSGVKKGFGSSAVVAVGLVCGIFFVLTNNSYFIKNKIFMCCIEAYRYAQGGMGSGYDIATSLFGGIIRFKGGNFPMYELLEQMCFSDFYLMQGPKSVKTTSSIVKYCENKASLMSFMRDTNIIMEKIVLNASRSSAYLFSSLKSAKDIGLEIGKRIGISADLPLDISYLEKECALIKALGAGNETFLVYKPNFEVFKQFNLEPIEIDLEGVKFCNRCL
ncbi:phosphomevalonate kinase [Borrelia miyamotoi]|uniref:Phosphomevalonate kinase n=1 Tax=Borrelia miyamotoi TaxID=47466 RepID=A0AAX3JKY3_9SPIR|nr:phosphomevalonate kinase [Borrelia miyamotoi]QFP41686.1 phosphomevalonate kinase [Borrelia miyamotoi]QFP47806.1 phosphomevalonate kinase [Borrelia miyamotoi]QGT55566.1 phosphomevalonate kinase [Borrelia miyamotoi]QGT56350.1 phosphomevalonate kinase [Borrelia miyamotoi]WAZ71595.1 phosphomevalonate kinase [Borrelia miyamotoi]